MIKKKIKVLFHIPKGMVAMYYESAHGSIPSQLAKYLRKAVEYGYNKANEELEEKYKETFCNLEMNLNSVTERLEELEKANEWNYVKDGIFPKDEKDILCQINFETYEVGYYHQEKRCFYTIDGREIDVIAWKEIELPKEEMENESHT